MERGGFRFSPGKIFSPIFLSLSLSHPPLFFPFWTGSIGLLSSISAIPSPYSKVSQSATTFARLSFFPLPSLPLLAPRLLLSPFPRPQPRRSGQRASENMNPSSRPHCLGPVFATGTHRRNLFGPLGTRTRVRACVSACVRLFARRW